MARLYKAGGNVRKGFVYVLSNASMPGLVKIGKTSRLLEQRSSELFTTGVAMPFVIEFAIFVGDMDGFEARVHEELDDFRVNDAREFFRIAVDDAILRVTDLFVREFDHRVAFADDVIELDDLMWYARVSEVPPPDVVQVIGEFREEEWRQAAARLENKRKAEQAA